MWGLPLATFLSFVVLFLTIVFSIIWAIFSDKSELDDAKENQV